MIVSCLFGLDEDKQSIEESKFKNGIEMTNTIVDFYNMVDVCVKRIELDLCERYFNFLEMLSIHIKKICNDQSEFNRFLSFISQIEIMKTFYDRDRYVKWMTKEVKQDAN